MPEVESIEKQPQSNDMSPEEFAEINIEALKTLLDKRDAEDAERYIRTIVPNSDKVSAYVTGLIVASHLKQAYADTVADILAARPDTE